MQSFVTTQAREGIETRSHMARGNEVGSVTTQAREGIETLLESFQAHLFQ